MNQDKRGPISPSIDPASHQGRVQDQPGRITKAGRLELPGTLPVATWQGFRPGMIDRREHHQRAARVHRLELTSHRYRITKAGRLELPGTLPVATWQGFRPRMIDRREVHQRAARVPRLALTSHRYRISLEGSPRPGVWSSPECSR